MSKTTTVAAVAAVGALAVSAFTSVTLFQAAQPAIGGQCHITTIFSGESSCRDVSPFFGYCFPPRYPGVCPT